MVSTPCGSRRCDASRRNCPRMRRMSSNTRFIPFRKRSGALDTGEQERLETLLAYSPPLRQAYTLREQLTSIFDTARSKKEGLRRIRLWRRRVERSALRCFDQFLKLLDKWLDLIANYFISHQTSSFVDGLNNTLKVLKRRCY